MFNFKHKSELRNREFELEVQSIRLDTEIALAEMGYDKERRKEFMGKISYVL